MVLKIEFLTQKKHIFFWLTLLIIGLSQTSCKKKEFFSTSNLSFSSDTVVFDTIFTTIGSTTKQFKIYNIQNAKIKIESIQLMGGSNSPFRINVDGVSGLQFGETVLDKKDSLYVFVDVTLQVNNGTLPLIIEDSIRFRTNGKDQYVKLAVWGQDAYFHYKDLNSGTWQNDKPHVIYGYAAVDSAQTLTIPGGTNIYLHKNAQLINYKGTLNMNGSLGNEITLQGDRLENMYSDVTGQYYGIYFYEARPSQLNYVNIKNGTSGIHLYSRDASQSGYTLTLTNSKIENCASYGLFIYSGAKVKAENCIISKNGYHALFVLEGGDFNMNHCHLLGYQNGSNQTPAVGISNFYYNPNTSITTVASINEGSITNSVIYGNQSGEIAFDTLATGGVTLNFNLKNNVIKMDSPSTSSIFVNTIWNANPLFTNISESNYKFPANSPLNAAGFSTSVSLDILGMGRNNPPDIGAYELN